MPARHGIRITPDTIDIVTFLNNGIRPEIAKEQNTFLICEVNGPREITTKVMTIEELNAELNAAPLHELL
jgi:hypothetical protein